MTTATSPSSNTARPRPPAASSRTISPPVAPAGSTFPTRLSERHASGVALLPAAVLTALRATVACTGSRRPWHSPPTGETTPPSRSSAPSARSRPRPIRFAALCRCSSAGCRCSTVSPRRSTCSSARARTVSTSDRQTAAADDDGGGADAGAYRRAHLVAAGAPQRSPVQGVRILVRPSPPPRASAPLPIDAAVLPAAAA